MVGSHLVVNSPHGQGSVIGLIKDDAKEKTCLEIHREIELDCTVAEAQAECARGNEADAPEDYLAGPEEQIRQILLEILEAKPRRKKSSTNLRTETFECLYGEKGNNVIPEVVFRPRVLLTIAKAHERSTEASSKNKPAPTPFASLWCKTCKQLSHQYHVCVGVPSYAEWTIVQAKSIINEWQGTIDQACINGALEAAAEVQDAFTERQLICAERRYITVHRMFRKGTISKSAMEEAKEYYATLLRKEEVERMNLAMDSCK